uniref:Uncharacterized protein n=1 Tax=candidate division WWE3 bacterium TaxID=2053526 RepID=A0A7C4XH99_UNCKA
MSNDQAEKALRPFIQNGEIVTDMNDPLTKISGTTLAELFTEGYVIVFGPFARLTEKGKQVLRQSLVQAVN